MSYNAEMGLTTQTIAVQLDVTPKRVREIAHLMGIKPMWIGQTMLFTPAQVRKMRDRDTKRGPKPKRKR